MFQRKHWKLMRMSWDLADAKEEIAKLQGRLAAAAVPNRRIVVHALEYLAGYVQEMADDLEIVTGKDVGESGQLANLAKQCWEGARFFASSWTYADLGNVFRDALDEPVAD